MRTIKFPRKIENLTADIIFHLCSVIDCCGIEITPDNPHFEVGTSINHFPDGVFNDCRVVKERLQKRIDSSMSSQRHDMRNRTLFTPRIVPS